MKQKRWMQSVIAAAAEAALSPRPALPWTRAARAARAARNDRTGRNVTGAATSGSTTHAAIRSA